MLELSKIVIGVLLIVGVSIIFSNILIDLSTNGYPDSQLNDTMLANYTKNYENLTQIYSNANQLQENSSLRLESNQIWTNDNILTTGVKGLGYIWDTITLSKNMLNSAVNDLKIPANIALWATLVIIALCVIAVMTLFMRQQV